MVPSPQLLECGLELKKVKVEVGSRVESVKCGSSSVGLGRGGSPGGSPGTESTEKYHSSYYSREMEIFLATGRLHIPSRAWVEMGRMWVECGSVESNMKCEHDSTSTPHS